MSHAIEEMVIKLAKRVGGSVVEPGSGHERWRLYLNASDIPSVWGTLREVVVCEDDHAIALSLVLRMLERVDSSDRDEWAELLSAKKDREFARRRVKELGLLDLALVGSWRPSDGELVAGHLSAWLQLRLAETSSDSETIFRLRRSGATKRVRSVAIRRSESLGHH